MKYTVCICMLVVMFPLIVYGATSTNFQLSQEGIGSIEFSANSTNYQFQAVVGTLTPEISTSTNYTFDQKRVEVVVVTPSPSSGGGGGGGGGNEGGEILVSTDTGCPPRGDLNDDCLVNLVDLSIAGFWYKQVLSDSFTVTESTVLNGDGIVDLVDLSIMGFYWTG